MVGREQRSRPRQEAKTKEPEMPKTPPPKPEDYIVVDGSDGPRRDFRISVGLQEGWDAEGRVFDARGGDLCVAARGRHCRVGPRTRRPVHGRGGACLSRSPAGRCDRGDAQRTGGRARRCAGRSASMSPSPTGPGSWTPASTPAGREKGGTGLLRWPSLLLNSEPQLSQHFNSP